MEQEKIKEIKKALECCQGETPNCIDCAYWGNCKKDYGAKIRSDILTLINELESENERLIKIKDNALEIIKQGEQQIINIAKETLKDFREKYKEALKEAVKGENVDCFVESLKIFDKTIEEKICDLK